MSARPRTAPAPAGGLTVVILTFNEELHIARAIAAVKPFASETLVVDSFSTDATVKIARRLGARIVQHPFETQAAQMQWALDQAGVATDWVMRLDADEVVEPDLAAAIADQLPTLPPDVTGLVLNRKHIFLGRWIRHGGRYPMYMLRIWRRGCARVEQRLMDEHVVLTSGRSVTLEGGFADHNLHDLSFFTAKHNGYATREALEALRVRRGLGSGEGSAALASVSQHTRRRRMLKEAVYDRAGLLAGPLGYFLYRYIVQLGWLDGREGLIYHLLQGFWYRFLVAAKTLELERAVAAMESPAEVASALQRLTGYRLTPPAP